MDLEVDPTESLQGPYGRAEFVPLPSLDEGEWNPVAKTATAVSCGTWIITAPGYHPAWSQYVLNAISLKDAPGVKEAWHKFDGSTHEILLVAIDPSKCPDMTVEKMQEYMRNGKMPYLTPVNIAEQFECSDEEIRQLCWFACLGVVDGILNPETGDAPSRIRMLWLEALTKTLAHIRGEAHDSGPDHD